MTIFWDSLYFLIFFGLIPIFLFLRAWGRYRVFKCSGNKSLFLARAALASLSLPVGMLIFQGAVAGLGEHIQAVKTIDNILPPGWELGIANALLSSLSLVLALSMLRGTKDMVRVGVGATVASIYLMIIWLWVVINPH